jgi:hypothetical protein
MRIFEAEGLIHSINAYSEISFERWSPYHVSKIELAVHASTKTEIDNWMAVEDAVRSAQGRIRLIVETVSEPEEHPLAAEIRQLIRDIETNGYYFGSETTEDRLRQILNEYRSGLGT